MQRRSVPLIVIAGKEYGTGSSRDWAAKGPKLLGVRAVVAETFERIHRSNLIGMGIAPLVAGLAPDMIVVVGEVTRAWHQVGPIIKETVKKHTFTRAETQIVPSDPITQPRLRGTIALVLLKHFGAPAIV